MAERLTSYFQLLKTTDTKAKIPITPTNIMNGLTERNKGLNRCCQLVLRQPLPGKQLVLMTDASFQAAGYALLIEGDPSQKYTSIRKTYAPIAYVSKTYTPSQLKIYIYAKEFLAIYLAFTEFGHFFGMRLNQWLSWQTGNQSPYSSKQKWFLHPFGKPVILYCSFSFTIEHIPGRLNTAADFPISFRSGP